MAVKNTDSQVWKRMLKLTPLAQKNCYWKICTGKCFFWDDVWSNQGELAERASGTREEQELIKDYGTTNNWSWDKLSEFLPMHVAIRLFTIPFNSETIAVPMWKITSNGFFNKISLEPDKEKKLGFN